LFVGSGRKEDIEYVKNKKGCTFVPFVPTTELPRYYWAADIGVWPREESTSQLDAMACDLPLILSDKISVIERINGNGLLYKEGDHKDLANKIESIEDNKVRERMYKIGVEKALNKLSWMAIAKDRVNDYINQVL
jgi:glycosyltransferase involved in cell wall biosynthesis